MNNSEYWIDVIVTKAQALNEVADHGIDASEFLEDYGDHDQYDAYEVLQWLGY